ncbi:hypothetical protein AB0H00_29510 [Nocardia sp. NPDC023852]|uniref:hypothetical protein n=1 Tax=Nocardia sp. NPDC023852 TaxID=3154697 RepID=UPI0033F08428
MGTPRSLPSAPRREPRGSRPAAALGIVALVVLVVVVVLAVAVNTDKAKAAQRASATVATTVTATSTTVAVSTTLAAPPHAHTLPGCAQTRAGNRVSGTGPGSTSSGPDAILAFEHAYYVLRSGIAVRAVVEGTAIPDAEQIQHGIDQVPADTRYCVEISPMQAGRFLVDLTEQWPGEPSESFTQVVTTTSTSGRTLITAIAPT